MCQRTCSRNNYSKIRYTQVVTLLTDCEPGCCAIIWAINAANGLFGELPGAVLKLFGVGADPVVVVDEVDVLEVVTPESLVVLGAAVVGVDNDCAGNPTPMLQRTVKINIWSYNQ